MDNIPVIYGEAGGGGGGPRKPVESPDTLQSRQRARLLFAISEGEIDSITQVYVNGTPIEAFDATWELRPGTPNQTHIPGFSQVETPGVPAVNVEIKQNIKVIRETSTSSTDAVRITLRINALYFINDDGDTLGKALDIQVLTRKDINDVWTVAHDIHKNDKASSPYKMDIRVDRPANSEGSTWQFAVERLTIDDENNKNYSITFFDTFTEIQDSVLTYPYTAVLGVIFNDADELGGKIPIISQEAVWQKINVPDPSVYNPASRLYTGSTWTGAWALSKYPSSCLAWALYYVLTDSRAGRGIPENKVNKFSFFDFAVECDELVDAGNSNGSTEHRFSIDNQFYKRENAATFIDLLLTLGNAKLATDEFGLISVISNRPQAVSKIVNNSNVIEGEFNYSSGELDETFSHVNVTYNDPLDKHNTTTIYEERPDRLAKYGLIKADVVLAGCKHEGQARRKAKFILYTPDELVTFKVMMEGMVYRIGELMSIMDDDHKLVSQQGRIVSAVSNATSTTITLDEPLTFENQSYSVLCYGDNGVDVYDRAITQQNETTDTIVIVQGGALATEPNKDSPYIIRGDIVPSKFKVVDIDRDESVFTITGSIYDENINQIIEGGLSNIVPTTPFINTDGFLVEPVENIQFLQIFSSGLNGSNRINVSWDWDVDGSENLIATYSYVWRRDSIQFSKIETTAQKEFDIDGVRPGVYEVIITAFNVRGIRSSSVTALFNYRTIAAESTLKPPLNFYVANTTSNVFNNKDLSVTWFYDVQNDDPTLVNDSLLDYVVEIWGAGVLKETYIVPPHANKNGSFVYTFQNNEDDHSSVTRAVEMRLYSRDVIGDVSTSIAETFTNPVPVTATFSLISGLSQTFVNITPAIEPDFAGYIIYRSETSGFTPGPANTIYDGPDTAISLSGDSGKTYYYRVAVYDSFSKAGLNIGGQQDSATLSTQIDSWIFQGLTFKPNDPSSNKVSWTSGSASKNGAIPLIINAGNATWTSGTLIIYYDGSSNTLSSTDDLGIAVSGAQSLATYKGGTNLIVGDGNAFIDGGLVLAGTVGANQLVADSAIITNTAQIQSLIVNSGHIENGAITNAKIGDTIQSSNFSNVLNDGWEIDKQGNITSYGTLDIRDGLGNVVIATGANAGLEWDRVLNAGGNRPDDNATFGAIGVTNIDFTKGVTSSILFDVNFFGGVANDGEFDINPGEIVFPGGTVRQNPTIIGLATPFEGVFTPEDNVFYIVWGVGDADDRFSTIPPTDFQSSNAGWFSATYNRHSEQWTAYLNELTGEIFTPLETDVFLARCLKRPGATGTERLDLLTVNADVTFNNLPASGVNICNHEYSVFEDDTLPTISGVSINAIISADSSVSYFGQYSLKIIATGGNAFVPLGKDNEDYNVKISPNKKWILSCYVRSNAVNSNVTLYVRTGDAAYHIAANTLVSAANTWERVSGIADLSSNSNTVCAVRLDNDAGAGVTMNFDGVMLEEMIGSLSEPSAYSIPSITRPTWDNLSDIPYSTVYNNDDSTALGFNPSFADWPLSSALPTQWSGWSSATVIRETNLVRVGANSVRFNSPSDDQGIAQLKSWFNSPLPTDTIVVGTVDIYMPSRTSGLPGILVDLVVNSSDTLTRREAVQPISNATNTWHRVTFTARTNPGEQIYAIRIYIMGRWAAFPSGAFVGSVIFDNLKFAFFDSSVDNTNITLQPDGTLSGAGGGQVSITGLGYTGDLNANRTTDTNQLSDGANLGGTALWGNVASRPTTLSGINAAEAARLAAMEDNATNTTNTNQLTDGANLGGAVIGSNLTGTFDFNNIGVFMPAATIGQAQMRALSVGNAQIQNLAVGNAQMQDLSVSTLKVAGNAITLPMAVSSNVEGTQAVALTLTVTTTGAPLLVSGTIQLESQFQNNIAEISLFRDTAAIVTDGAVISSGQPRLITFVISEQIPAGTYIYSLKVFGNVSHRFKTISTLETKR